MPGRELHVVTGAFGYTGRHITARLLEAGKRVRTLTGHTARINPFGSKVEVEPLDFSHPERIAEALRGASVLHNTYWVRFPHRGTDFDLAVENSKALLSAAADAGVERIVHISITNPVDGSPLPYFRGKAAIEKEISALGVSHAIVRPTVIFGSGDVFINNIAWMLRRFPVFTIPGTGEYRLQPVAVDDVARICVEASGRRDSEIIEAAGPEVFSFGDMVKAIARAVGSRSLIVNTPPRVALVLSKLVGYAVRDVVLTGQELEGLMSSLVVARGSATGEIRFSGWLQSNGHTLGRHYASELRRHYQESPRTGYTEKSGDPSKGLEASA